jgi:uncharacterized membrane protein
MDFTNFLRSLVAGNIAEVAAVALVVGAFVFGLIEFFDWLAKKQNPNGIPAQFKFWLALVLSFVVPIGAYLLLQLQEQQPIGINGLYLAAGVGYMASQAIHRLLEGKPEKEQPGGIT